jgi:hypothetical protein
MDASMHAPDEQMLLSNSTKNSFSGNKYDQTSRFGANMAAVRSIGGKLRMYG